MSKDKFYTTGDVARMIGITVMSVHGRIGRGTLNASRLSGDRRWRISQAEVNRLRKMGKFTNLDRSATKRK